MMPIWEKRWQKKKKKRLPKIIKKEKLCLKKKSNQKNQRPKAIFQ